MDKSTGISVAIKVIITTMMDRVLNRVLIEDPFIADVHKANKPLYAALVPDEIFKGSHFERRFVTPFGGVWEKLSKAAAENVFDIANTQHPINGTIKAEQLRRIQETLNKLEHRERGKDKILPNWDKELSYIRMGNIGKSIPVQVICDLYLENHNGDKFAFEIKAPLPNSDQTKVSKEKLLKLYCMENSPITNAYYALPYNPYGRREDYNWAFPARWFDMQKDSSVLIGDEFWNKIGGEGTYQLFISEINKLGKEYRTRIYKEYLGINPPERDDNVII